MIFLFFGSSLAHLEPKLQLFEVWEMMVRQIIIASIAMVVVGVNHYIPIKGEETLLDSNGERVFDWSSGMALELAQWHGTRTRATSGAKR